MVKKYFPFLLVGFVLGVTLFKSEAASWYRIYEMFHFQSFHMYGTIGVAFAVGLIGVQWIKRTHRKSVHGQPILIADKEPGNARYLIGGTLFGLGWALAGACPAPVFVVLAAGYYKMAIVLIGAVIGTFLYGMIRSKLPH